MAGPTGGRWFEGLHLGHDFRLSVEAESGDLFGDCQTPQVKTPGKNWGTARGTRWAYGILSPPKTQRTLLRVAIAMSNPFFDHPILNSPYARPARHWELDESGQPTQKILETPSSAEFITPIPKPKKQKKMPRQEGFIFDEGEGYPPRRSSMTTLDHQRGAGIIDRHVACAPRVQASGR